MGENLVALETDGCRVNAEVTPVWNARSPVEDRFEERSVTFEEEETPGRRISLIVRAYDDGVGFRYGIPDKTAVDRVTITAEQTEFRFGGDHTAWYTGRQKS